MPSAAPQRDGTPTPPDAPDVARRFSPFRIGLQSFTLRALTLEEMLDAIVELGIREVEAIPELSLWLYTFGSHVPVVDDPAEIASVRRLFESRGLRLAASGVHRIDEAAEAERLFSFARAMGIGVLTIDPAESVIDACDRLCADHPEVRLAIHNHGPWTRYDSIADVERALEGRHPGFGACVDTGHFIRSGEDPVDAVRRLGDRVHAVHLKDHADAGLFASSTLLGQGRLRLDDFLGALLETGRVDEIPVALEYEAEPGNPLPAVRGALATIDEAIARLDPRAGDAT